MHFDLRCSIVAKDTITTAITVTVIIIIATAIRDMSFIATKPGCFVNTVIIKASIIIASSLELAHFSR